MEKNSIMAMESSQDMDHKRKMVYIFAQDFTVLEVLYPKLMLRKSAKSWIWPLKWERLWIE
jgi:hypothetical protein